MSNGELFKGEPGSAFVEGLDNVGPVVSDDQSTPVILLLGVVLEEPNPKDEFSELVLEFPELFSNLIRFKDTIHSTPSVKKKLLASGVGFTGCS